MRAWGTVLDIISIVKNREPIRLFKNPTLEKLASTKREVFVYFVPCSKIVAGT